mgnify:CR=1 FL=1
MSIFWEKKKKAKVHFAVSTTDAKKLGFLHTSRKWELRREQQQLTREARQKFAQKIHSNQNVYLAYTYNGGVCGHYFF